MLKSPPGYGPVVLLDRERHRGLGVAADGERFGNRLHAIYVSLAEFFEALHCYPIVFVTDSGTQETVPAVLTGLDLDRNLFVDDDGRWLRDAYRPAYVRRYPFCVVDHKDTPGSFAVCVEEQALTASATPLFDGDGKETPAWLDFRVFIEEVETARAATREFVRALVDMDLLEPFEAHVHPHGGEPARLRGLQRVAEARLQALDAQVLKRAQDAGHLTGIYAHLFSLRNFRELLNRRAAGCG